MISLYSLTYLAAKKFNYIWEELRYFDIFVDVINCLDVCLIFFTAKRKTELTEIAQRELNREKDEELIEDKPTARTQWCINLKYIAIDYITSFFLIDVLCTLPLIIGHILGDRHLLGFRFLRGFQISRMLDEI